MKMIMVAKKVEDNLRFFLCCFYVFFFNRKKFSIPIVEKFTISRNLTNFPDYMVEFYLIDLKPVDEIEEIIGKRDRERKKDKLEESRDSNI